MVDKSVQGVRGIPVGQSVSEVPYGSDFPVGPAVPDGSPQNPRVGQSGYEAPYGNPPVGQLSQAQRLALDPTIAVSTETAGAVASAKLGSLRVSFKVDKVATLANGSEEVTLSPLHDLSTHADSRVSTSAPQGSITLTIDNHKVQGFLALGKTYFVDFHEAR